METTSSLGESRTMVEKRQVSSVISPVKDCEFKKFGCCFSLNTMLSDVMQLAIVMNFS